MRDNMLLLPGTRAQYSNIEFFKGHNTILFSKDRHSESVTIGTEEELIRIVEDVMLGSDAVWYMEKTPLELLLEEKGVSPENADNAARGACPWIFTLAQQFGWDRRLRRSDFVWGREKWSPYILLWEAALCALHEYAARNGGTLAILYDVDEIVQDDQFRIDFVYGFEDGMPDGYSSGEDFRAAKPWCEPWRDEGINLKEWFDPERYAWLMGKAWAAKVTAAWLKEFGDAGNLLTEAEKKRKEIVIDGLTVLLPMERNAYFYWDDCKDSPESAFFELDLQKQTLTVGWSTGIDVPESVVNGRILRFMFPATLSLRAVRNRMERIASEAAQVVAGYCERIRSDGRVFGVLTPKAQRCSEWIEELLIDDILESGDVRPPKVTYWLREPDGTLIPTRSLDYAVTSDGNNPYVLCDRCKNVWGIGDTLIALLKNKLSTELGSIQYIEKKFTEEFNFSDWDFYPTTDSTYAKFKDWFRTHNNPDERLTCFIDAGYAFDYPDTKEKYVERLNIKGIQCRKHDSCSDCLALTALTKEDVVGDNGFARKELTIEELRHYSLFGECALGFDQEWKTWGNAIPRESCPKPIVEEDLLRCIMRSN